MRAFPKNGLPIPEVESHLEKYLKRSALYRYGKNWGMGFYPPDVAIDAYLKFIDSNMIYAALGAGNPFPGITDMEAEAIGMMGDVFGNPEARGNITIGGTEANIIALKVARDFSGKKVGSVVLPTSAHPSFIKGCHLMGIEAIRVPVEKDYRVSPKRVAESIRDDTIALVSTCGTHTHGTIDPVEEIGKVAEERDLFHHVDAAWGGLICCWLRKANEYDVPAFDFAIPSVKSMTVDPHKQGFAPMPAGGILFRNDELHKGAAFEFIDEMHGHYFSWTLQGSRTGGPIAAVWALFNYYGEDGYTKLARKCMELTYKLVKGIRAVPGLRVPVDPKMNIFAVHTEDYNVDKVVASLEGKGWTGLYVTQDPPSFRCVVLPHHEKQIELFLSDLEEVTNKIKRPVVA